MTQEQIIRQMLDGFASDPPDSEYQQGFMAAIAVIAVDVMGFEWNDPSVLNAEKVRGGDTVPDAQSTIKKAKAFKVMLGGKPDTEG